jgi:hypothetical protein
VLDVAQTIAVIAAAIASVYAVVASERNRRFDARRARVERVLAAIMAMTDAAAMAQQDAQRRPDLEAARLRLRAELEIVGVRGFESTDLMVRPGRQPGEVVSQSEAAIIEIRKRLDELEELASRPLILALLPRRGRRA